MRKKERLDKNQADTNSCQVSSQLKQAWWSEAIVVVTKKRARSDKGTQKDMQQVKGDVEAILVLVCVCIRVA